MTRPLTIHTFASMKGGVGKSTLAWVTASLLAERGRGSVVIDADFTGSSFADALDLRAPLLPDLPGVPGVLDLGAEPERLMTLEETIGRRLKRKSDHRLDDRGGTWLPYLNDFMTWQLAAAGGGARSVSSLMWREREDSLAAVMPSSPLLLDLRQAAQWSASDDELAAWTDRLALLLSWIAGAHETVTDIILDLAPGLHSFALDALRLLTRMAQESPMEARTWLVCSPDRNDFIQAVEGYVQLHQGRQPVPGVRLLLNRSSEGIDTVWGRASRVLDRQYQGWGIADRIASVTSSDVLGALFRGQSFAEAPTERLSFLLEAGEQP